MLRLAKPPPGLLRRVLEDQRSQPLSYPEVGATAGTLPPGYHHDRFQTDLGPDDGGRFERAGRAILDWVPQRGAGIGVFPDVPVQPDMTMVLTIRLPVAGWAVAPARVVYVLDEPARAGFAYGTLPAHPERGEEAFLVTRGAGRVVFQVIAFSQPSLLLARLGAPVARAFQVRTITSYLRAMEDAVG
ncbi:MAG TPA: DUF1990 domain-containing protein [Acidimicrobiales bacterium]|jgi:uncharacterized protein (UPF0548 family)|nr:DUF1990 domain-containing protein [Acidimicrobiales bacterium]